MGSASGCFAPAVRSFALCKYCISTLRHVAYLVEHKEQLMVLKTDLKCTQSLQRQQYPVRAIFCFCRLMNCFGMQIPRSWLYGWKSWRLKTPTQTVTVRTLCEALDFTLACECGQQWIFLCRIGDFGLAYLQLWDSSAAQEETLASLSSKHLPGLCIWRWYHMECLGCDPFSERGDRGILRSTPLI